MLLDIFDNDSAAVGDLLDSALESIEVDYARIESSNASTDFPGVLEAAHRLKGTSGSIASQRIAETSSLIERAAGERKTSVIGSLLGELRPAIDALVVDIDAAKQEMHA